jgi:alanyl-tRNA synthetase
MSTKRLYYDDSYLAEFEATVAAHGQVGGRAAVALDRSAFYPEGGGQPADRGALNGCAVADVQAEGETVWHVLAQPEELAALPVGAAVRGTIDRARRLDHMQQHCGQHILTAAFIASGGPPTVSFHLSDASVTIDLDAAELSEAQVRAAEELANRVVWEDRPVLARFVAPEELATIALRKPPTVSGAVRVVSVEEFDHSACGGTHPRSTGSVGVVAVLGWSRQRGGTRVEFACGGRALRELRRLAGAAGAAAATLSVGVDELPAAAERALAAQRALAKELAQAQAALDEAAALRLYAGGEAAGAARVAAAALAGLSAERLRAVAQQIAARPGGVAVIGAAGERAQLCVACAPDSGRDARAILQAGLAVLGGRGGGSAALAQGGGPAGDRLETALEAMRAAALAGG